MSDNLAERIRSLPENERAQAQRYLREHLDKARSKERPASSAKPSLSLFFFASEESADQTNQYDLVLAAARIADERGLEAVWTPERHFHPFGGLYPNPSMMAAALATITRRIGLRAGSIVGGLHHPVRIAEDWSVIDNLSGGRAGVSFASGWAGSDFKVLRAEDASSERHNDVFAVARTVNALWAGEASGYSAGDDQEPLLIRPRPCQEQLPTWISVISNVDNARRAGEQGYYLLTAMLRQSPDQVAELVQTYRAARAAAGHTGPGHVTVMAHTYIGATNEGARESVRGPLKSFLSTYVDLAKAQAPSTPDLDLADQDAIIEYALSRFLTTNGVIGDAAAANAMLDRLQAAGVDEVACLIDFGIDHDQVLACVHRLAEIGERRRERDSGPTPADRQFPLSRGQRRQLVAIGAAQRPDAYNIRSAVELTGHVEVAILQRATEEVAQRHPMLRCTVNAADLTYSVPATWFGMVWTQAAPTDRATYLQNEISRPFDLTTGPLFRAIWVEGDDGKNVLLLVAHHLVADGWSIHVLQEEIVAVYAAWLQDDHRPIGDILGEPPAPFHEFVEAESQHVLGSDDRQFWRTALADVPPLSTVYPDQPRTGQGRTHHFAVDDSLANELQDLRTLTPYSALVASWALAWAAHLEQRSLVVGVPFANRTDNRFRTTVGPFVNILPLVIQISPAITVRSLATEVASAVADMHDHQGTPLEDLFGILRPQRMPHVQPLFQTVVVMQSAHRSRRDLNGVTARQIEFESGTAKFDVVLDVISDPAGLRGFLEYQADLLTPAEAKGLINQTLTNLEAVVRQPDANVIQLMTNYRRINLRSAASEEHADARAGLRARSRRRTP